MKILFIVLLCLQALLSVAQASAQAVAYSEFATNDEANNIQIFKRTSPSVVNITNARLVRSFYSLNPQQVPQGSGTGFVWDKQGHIVTNFHVVQQADRVLVTLQDGTTYSAKAVGLDPSRDLAVLKIEAPDEDLIPVSPGDSSLLEVGRKVIAIGNPFGLDTTMTVGIVSALGREIDAVNQRKIRDVIQTDAAINPGNSGGPLLNSMGQLIGVNTAIFSPSGGSSGIGFAIPVNTVKRVVPELITYGRVQTPILGITLLPQPDYYRHLWGIEGVIVRDTVQGSDPQRLGMRGVARSVRGRIVLGDVIVEVDGQPIRNENDLAMVMEQKQAGDRVSVTTRRDNDFQHYQIYLQAPQGR
ncbi:MAG: trypsin-like peptidase domain-containing protein [Gammaproteobacteria bacterium]|nr:trypsin-like peptidase domain-containing protein [Gammaproteobacteria bacterium]MCY4358924.1 trypsin-like peptidase domain-containing protein [Gammaproteobacteria bacterium]